ncbi:MAG: ABC transporter ATP-binding protein [SAR324 cluster bacterium]|nr:ABC transporter ATP-binding protein [SAR324 cluster bacterium]
MSTSVLDINGLYKKFDSSGWVIEDCTLSVQSGEILYVLGPSGSGKTTLLRLICGFESPDAGQIVQGNRIISSPGLVLPPERRRIGMVFQDYAIFPHLTVRGNVSFGLARPFPERVFRGLQSVLNREPEREQPLSGEQRQARLEEMFKLTGLQGLEDRYPHELSGGQQQRVALARALALRPDLVLLDEPFSNLDTNLRQRIREEVKDVLKQSGATSILVTHDQEEAINMADRIAVMNKGRLEQVGTADDLFHAPRSRFVATFIGLSGFMRGEIVGKRVRTELGSFALPAGMAVPPSRAVDVLLRPDHIEPARNGKGTPAQVVQTDFVGVQTLYTLALPSGLKVQALFPGHRHLVPGDKTSIRFTPPKLVVFPVE